MSSQAATPEPKKVLSRQEGQKAAQAPSKRERITPAQGRLAGGPAPFSAGSPGNTTPPAPRPAPAARHSVSLVSVNPTPLPGPIQAKLLINQPGDAFEREADRAAEQVLGPNLATGNLRPTPPAGRGIRPTGGDTRLMRKAASQLTPLPRRRRKKDGEGCCPDETVQAAGQAGYTPQVGSALEASLAALQGGGRPLPDSPRRFFEDRFGYNFSQVRVHTGAGAERAAHQARARAFTRGQDIVFGAGQWAPEASAGQRLLAHELAHVIQQDGAGGMVVQRQAEGEAAGPEAGASPAEDFSGEPAPAASYLLEDDISSEPGPGQMRKSDFLAALRAATCEAADTALAAAGRSSAGCPYLDYWFGYYGGRSAGHIERAIHHYEPAAASASSASDYIRLVTGRIQTGVQRWVETGEITGMPPDIPEPAAGRGASPPAPEAGGSVQRKPAGDSSPNPALLNNPQALRQRLGAGSALDGSVRSRMESAFGTSFSGVKLHTGSQAARLSSRLGARAFTVGEHIAFGSGEYQPGTLIGDALLAHELAHVVQQGGAQAEFAPLAQDGGAGYSTLESDADTAAVGAVLALWTGARGALANIARNAKPALRSGLRLQRCDLFGSSSSGSSSSSSAPPPPPPPPPPLPSSDFQILGAEQAAGDTDNIYFDRSSSAISPAELAKVPAIITTHGAATNLTLNGFRSEDEPATLATDRINAVDTELGTARPAAPSAHPAHTGTRAKVPMAAAGVGEINYRQVRKVEVLRTPTGLAAAPSRRPASCATSTVACAPAPNHFTRAQTKAEAWLTKANTELTKATLDPAVSTLLDTFFGGGGGAPAGTAAFVAGKLVNLKAHVHAMTTQHVCHNLCDSDCSGSTAYNVGSGIGVPPAGAMMTLCPTFFTHTDDSNAATLIHEGAHGTAGLTTRDFAYAHERGITILSTANARQNSDSYAALVQLINVPGSRTIGVSGDARVGMNAAEDRQAQVALAHLEKWLIFSYQSVASMYSTVNETLNSGAWPTAIPGPFGRMMMNRLSPEFGLTDPGSAAPFALPTNDDKFKLAAIHDRFHTMREVMHSSPIRMEKIAVGSDQWDPGPGATVRLTAAFFALPNDLSRVRRLLELLLIATPNVSATIRPHYITAANTIRTIRGAGP